MNGRMTTPAGDSMLEAAREVVRVALPLMVSAGTFAHGKWRQMRMV